MSLKTAQIAEKLVKDLSDSSQISHTRRQSMAQNLKRATAAYLINAPQVNQQVLQSHLINFIKILQLKNAPTLVDILSFRPDLETQNAQLLVKRTKKNDAPERAKTLLNAIGHILPANSPLIIHGSTADGRTTPYSDIDISIFVKSDNVLDKNTLQTLRGSINQVNQVSRTFDPISHHNAFINLMDDFDCYPQSFMPLSVLNLGIQGNCESLSQKVKTRDCRDLLFNTFMQLSLPVINIADRHFSTNAATTKQFISQYFMLPMLYYELKTDDFSDKRTIFTKEIPKIWPDEHLDTLNKFSQIREQWPTYDAQFFCGLSYKLIEDAQKSVLWMLDDLQKSGILQSISDTYLEGA